MRFLKGVRVTVGDWVLNEDGDLSWRLGVLQGQCRSLEGTVTAGGTM